MPVSVSECIWKHSYVCHIYIGVTRIRMHSYVCVPHIGMHSHMGHDSFICVAWRFSSCMWVCVREMETETEQQQHFKRSVPKHIKETNTHTHTHTHLLSTWKGVTHMWMLAYMYVPRIWMHLHIYVPCMWIHSYTYLPLMWMHSSNDTCVTYVNAFIYTYMCHVHECIHIIYTRHLCECIHTYIYVPCTWMHSYTYVPRTWMHS